MAIFAELTDSSYSRKVLVNLEEITYVEVVENIERKMTVIHFTSSIWQADRTVGVNEDYDSVKDLLIKARLVLMDTNGLQ